MTIKDQVESYLLKRGDWVPSSEIVKVFDLADDRIFRSVSGRPGLLSDIAISGDKGHKHITLATTTEWLRFKHRLRRHGIAELVRIRRLDHRRQNVTKTIKNPVPIRFERDTNQGVFLTI